MERKENGKKIHSWKLYLKLSQTRKERSKDDEQYKGQTDKREHKKTSKELRFWKENLQLFDPDTKKDFGKLSLIRKALI